MFKYLAVVRTGTFETFQLEGKLVVQIISFNYFVQYRDVVQGDHLSL